MGWHEDEGAPLVGSYGDGCPFDFLEGLGPLPLRTNYCHDPKIDVHLLHRREHFDSVVLDHLEAALKTIIYLCMFSNSRKNDWVFFNECIV